MTDVVYTIGADTSRYERAIDRMKSGTRAAGSVIKGALGVAAGAAAGGAAAFALMAKNSLGVVDNIHKLNQRLGVSTEALSQYQLVAETSGVKFDTLTMGMQRMQRRISEAAQGSGEAKDALLELGLSAEALNRLKPDAQFESIAEAMSMVKDESDKTRLAMRLFDSGGVALLQTMTNGAGGIRAMRQEADALGMTLSQQGADDVAAFNDAMAKLKASTQALAQTTMVQLAPALTDITNMIGAGLPSAVNFAIEAYNWLSRTSVQMVRGVTSGLIVFYDVLGHLPGSLGQPYRDAAAGLREFRIELEDFQAYQVAVMDTSKTLAASANAATGQFQFGEGVAVDPALQQQTKQRQAVTEEADRLRAEQIAKDLAYLNAKEQAELEYDERKLQHMIEQAEHEYQIRDEAEAKQNSLRRMSSTVMVSTITGAFRDVVSISQAQNKQLFGDNKKAAVALGLISTFAGAARAYKEHAYPYSVIAALAVTASGLAQVARIQSVNYGSNSSSSAASGGASTPTTPTGTGTLSTSSTSLDTGPIADAGAQGRGSLVINIQGDVLNEEYVDLMVEKINDAADRDVFINQSSYAKELT